MFVAGSCSSILWRSRFEIVERAIARAILRGEPIDEPTTRAGMLPSEFDEGTFNSAEVVVAYLASDKDPGLHASALPVTRGDEAR